MSYNEVYKLQRPAKWRRWGLGAASEAPYCSSHNDFRRLWPLNAALLPESHGRGETRVRLTPAHPKVARAPGGSTLGRVEGEPGADFTHLGAVKLKLFRASKFWSLPLAQLPIPLHRRLHTPCTLPKYWKLSISYARRLKERTVQDILYYSTTQTQSCPGPNLWRSTPWRCRLEIFLCQRFPTLLPW